MSNISRILVIIASCSLFAFINQVVLSPLDLLQQVGHGTSSSKVKINSKGNTSSYHGIKWLRTNNNTTGAAAGRLRAGRPSDQTSTSRRNTTTSSSSSHQHQSLPLYVGAGQGTTGTRTLYDAMCRLGIPSVHYEQYCIHPTAMKPTSLNETSMSPTMESLKHGVYSHQQALVYWKLLSRCVQHSRPKYVGSPNHCGTETFDRLASMLRNYVSQVVHSGIGSIHDVPYAHMVPFILKIANVTTQRNSTSTSEDNGDEDEEEPRGSILLLTERNADEWIKSRIKGHPQSADLICHDHAPIDAFDLDECIERHHDHIDKLLYSPKLIHQEFSLEKEEEFESLSRDAMDRYQKKMVNTYKPALRVNFWEQSHDAETLSRAVWNATRHLLQVTTNATILDNLETLAASGGLRLQRIRSIPDLIHDELELQEKLQEQHQDQK